MAMPIQTFRNRLPLIPTYYNNKHADGYMHTYIHTYLDIINSYMNTCTYQSTIPSHIPDTYLHRQLWHPHLHLQGTSPFLVFSRTYIHTYYLSWCSSCHIEMGGDNYGETSPWNKHLHRYIQTYIHTYIHGISSSLSTIPAPRR